MKFLKSFCVLLVLGLQSVSYATNADHVVCSFQKNSTKPPDYLEEVFTVYFKKSPGGPKYHQHTTTLDRAPISFSIAERDGGLNAMFIQRQNGVVVLSSDSIAPIAFVGEYGLPTLSISSELYYFMCRESDKGWITQSFPSAQLIN